MLCIAALASIATMSLASAQSARDPFTGFYVGANLSGVYAHGELSGVPVEPLKPHGLFGGAQVGYDFKLTEGIVLGARADIAFGSASATVYDGPNLHYSAKIDRVGSLQARLGYDINGRLLPYVTGGASFAHATGSIACPAGAPFGVCAFTGPFNASESQTNWGWVVGAGVEVALIRHWSAFVEYQHADYGSPTTTITTPFGTVSGKTEQKMNVAKFGVNYRF
jgi:outer membrane immunogenic protein